MARVPARMYRKITQRAYTRREFMGGVPGLRILQFHSGNKTENFPVALHLVCEERGQLRHTAMEAMRITAVRYMDKKAGRDNYHLHMRTYPHHVLRQNKQASGAGADRVSMGMRLSFGKPIGTAARHEPGQQLVTIHTVARAIDHAKEALRKVSNKLASPCYIEIESEDATRTVDEMLHVAEEAHGRALKGAQAEDDTEAEVDDDVQEESVEATDAEEGDAQAESTDEQD